MDYLTSLIVILVICGGISYAIANSRGTSGMPWFLVGVLLGPIGVIVTLVMAKGSKGYAAGVADLEALKTTGAITDGEYQFKLEGLKRQATGASLLFDCGRCGKPLAPTWKRCEFCKATFAEFAPVAS